MEIPMIVKKENRTYRFIGQPNNTIYLYEREGLYYRECFLISDLIGTVKEFGVKGKRAKKWI